MRYSYIYEARTSPALNGSSAVRRFEDNDAIEIRDGITFDFYTGLPHILPSEGIYYLWMSSQGITATILKWINLLTLMYLTLFTFLMY